MNLGNRNINIFAPDMSQALGESLPDNIVIKYFHQTKTIYTTDDRFKMIEFRYGKWVPILNGGDIFLIRLE